MDRQYDPDRNIAYISRTKRYIDEDGNEGIQTEVYKKTYGGRHFWRVWLGDLLHTLGLINNSKQLDIVFYVLENTDPANNVYLGTLRQTVERTGISYGTVAAIFKKMQEVDMIIRQSNGVYKVKPSLLMKGDNSKKQRLVVEYETIKQEQKPQNAPELASQASA